jgi:Resolvase, N terminal domain
MLPPVATCGHGHAPGATTKRRPLAPARPAVIDDTLDGLQGFSPLPAQNPMGGGAKRRRRAMAFATGGGEPLPPGGQSGIAARSRPAAERGAATGEFLATVISAVAQLERRVIGERMKAALRAKRARGERLDAEPEIPDEIAERIRAIRAEGQPMPAIAGALNGERVPTARGGRSYPLTIGRVLVRAAYVARVQGPPRQGVECPDGPRDV